MEDTDLLLEVYLKQHVRDEGVLIIVFAEKSVDIASLVESGYVLQDNYYRFETLKCSETGITKAQEFLLSSLEKKAGAVKEALIEIPMKLSKFLVGDCISRQSTWPTERTDKPLPDWRSLPFSDNRIWDAIFKILSVLEKHRLISKTRGYVSTRGG